MNMYKGSFVLTVATTQQHSYMEREAAPPSSVAIPVCPHCAEAGITTPAERRTTDKVDSKVYGKWFYVCPDASVHPDKKFFLMETEWIKKQNYDAKRKALGLDTSPAAADKKPKTNHPPPPPVLPNNAAANSTDVTEFRAEFQKGTQIMLDLLVTLKDLLRTMNKAEPEDNETENK